MALQQGKIPTIGRTDYVLLELWRDISWQAATDAVNQLTRAGYRRAENFEFEARMGVYLRPRCDGQPFRLLYAQSYCKACQ